MNESQLPQLLSPPPPTRMSYAELYPVHYAAQVGDVDAIKRLLDGEANNNNNGRWSPNTTDYECQTPLHVACLSGFADCAQLLIDFGAQVNATSMDGGTPICDAGAAGHADVVKLLLDNGAMVNPPHSLSTPLHEAAFGGSLDCVRLLINAGARLNTQDCNFGTPLHAAVFNNQSHVVGELVVAGADVDATKNHQTPLHLAVHLNHVESALELLRCGASVQLRDNQGRRPKELLGKPPPTSPTTPTTGSLLFDALDRVEKNPPTLKDACRRRLVAGGFVRSLLARIGDHQDNTSKLRSADNCCDDSSDTGLVLPKSVLEYINYHR